MLVAKVSSSNAPAEISAAYDYRAFGELVSLMEPAEKVTENFTGKEKDDETQLNYFGARYLDPSLGLWTSVDPKRFFPSPYLYMGNGYNPIISVDFYGLAPYDSFYDMDAAALDAGYTYQDEAALNDYEMGGAIYELNGSFGYVPAVVGEQQTVDVTFNNSMIPENARIVAYWHSHGKFTKEISSGNFNFSREDGDFGFAKSKGLPLYMIPPKAPDLAKQSGRFGFDAKMYDPQNGRVDNLGYVDDFQVRGYVNDSRVEKNR